MVEPTAPSSSSNTATSFFHPALAVSNIKSHVPIILEMKNVQYATCVELFKVHLLLVNMSSTATTNGFHWGVFFGLVCWKLWNMRCSFIFSTVCLPAHVIASQCKAWARNVTEHMQHALKTGTNIQIQRTLPLPVSIVINYDATVTSFVCRAGGVIRNCNGYFLGGFIRGLHDCTVLEAELWAILDAIQVAIEMGFRRFHIETACLQASTLLNGGREAWSNNTIARRLKKLLGDDREAQIVHIYRQTNMIADTFDKSITTTGRGRHFCSRATVEDPS